MLSEAGCLLRPLGSVLLTTVLGDPGAQAVVMASGQGQRRGR